MRDALTRTTFKEVVQRNAGIIWLGLLRMLRQHRTTEKSPQSLTVDDIVFASAALDFDLSGVLFRKCTFLDVDFRKIRTGYAPVRFDHCEFGSCTFFSERAPNSHRVVFDAPIFRGGSDLAGARFYDPESIIMALQGDPTVVVVLESDFVSADLSAARHAVVDPIMPLLRRFVKIAERHVRFSEADLENTGIAQQEGWQVIWESLEKAGLLESLSRSRRGTSGTLYRLTAPGAELLRPAVAEGRVAQFWELLGWK